MDLIGSDCQGLESVVMLERKGGQAFARPNCIRRLRDGEDALLVLSLPFLFAEGWREGLDRPVRWQWLDTGAESRTRGNGGSGLTAAANFGRRAVEFAKSYDELWQSIYQV